MKYFTLIFLFALIMSSCDKGLDPTVVRLPSILKGQIIYVGGKSAWPPDSTVKDIRVVAFRDYPPKNIFTEISAGKAYFSNSLRKLVDSDSFSISITITPAIVNYLVVAQQFGDNVLTDWRPIGVYTITGDLNKPSQITVLDGVTLDGLNINVDFKNLPPNPIK